MAVTVLPDWVMVAFQPLVSCTPDGKVHATVQLLIAVLPAVTVTEAVNPPDQELSVCQVAVQPLLPVPPVVVPPVVVPPVVVPPVVVPPVVVPPVVVPPVVVPPVVVPPVVVGDVVLVVVVGGAVVVVVGGAVVPTVHAIPVV